MVLECCFCIFIENKKLLLKIFYFKLAFFTALQQPKQARGHQASEFQKPFFIFIPSIYSFKKGTNNLSDSSDRETIGRQ